MLRAVNVKRLRDYSSSLGEMPVAFAAQSHSSLHCPITPMRPQTAGEIARNVGDIEVFTLPSVSVVVSIQQKLLDWIDLNF